MATFQKNELARVERPSFKCQNIIEPLLLSGLLSINEFIRLKEWYTPELIYDVGKIVNCLNEMLENPSHKLFVNKIKLLN